MSPQLYGERNQLSYFFFFYDANCSSPVPRLYPSAQSWTASVLACLRLENISALFLASPGALQGDILYYCLQSDKSCQVGIWCAAQERLQCRYEVLRPKHGTLRAGEIQVSLSDGKYFKYLGYFKIEKHKVRIGWIYSIKIFLVQPTLNWNVIQQFYFVR